MSATVKVYTRIVVTDQFGEEATFKNAAGDGATLSSLEEVVQIPYTLQSETETIFDASRYPDFALLVLEADGELEVELTVNEGDASEQILVLRLRANVPLILGDDWSRYGLSAGDDGFTAGTADVIDKVRVREANGNEVHLRALIAR